jgi:hypothetical protein
MGFLPVINPLLGKWVQLTYFLWGYLIPVVTILFQRTLCLSVPGWKYFILDHRYSQ